MEADHTTAVFVAELILLLFVGRMLGGAREENLSQLGHERAEYRGTEQNTEGMARIGQPAIFGQLLADDLVVLGASLRMGDKKFLGPRSAALVRAVKDPILLIAQ